MEAPALVVDLVERFDRNVDAYRSGAYNETQVRREFIDPLFKALGWDIDNEAGYAPAYKDVVHEDAIKIGGLTKAPDYCFRVGGTRKFFVEAKKPAVNLKDDISAAFQLRRYAWSAKLPLSILTDFDEFAAYDCRVRPEKIDGAAVARTMYLSYRDYVERWDEISSVFSKQAVLQGSFDRYAETTKGKKGTAEVDSAFLGEIEEWRNVLARTIALRNPGLTQRELNYAVQATIDRIIFLRICEDRGIEDYGGLLGLCNGVNTYPRLVEVFRRADQRYNSGLFHFEQERGRPEAPDTLTPGLVVDDKALKGILKRLYYPDSPYEFSVLPADILGQVYEQFLGKVIRLTPGHRAVVEDKPEVKKAGGVYYTPTYIVEYIVKNTVGKLLEGSSPKKAAELRILDPACGSGSFLIGAFQYLMDWHRDWYVADSPEKHKKEMFSGPGGEWRLTTAEKKRILTNNLYGVDIDAQAVETTKLSLLLKVLEGETQETINAQLSFLRERALPDLSNNIKCGNSLIGPDFYDNLQLGLTLFDEEERYRINAFDWEREFPAILGKTVLEERRGFDAVIGNPPYVRSQTLGELQRQYYRRNYDAATATYDIYVLFVERAVKLLNVSGRLGYILPNKFFTTDYGEGLRRLLMSSKMIDQVVDFQDGQVFPGAGTYTCLLLLSRTPVSPGYASLGGVFRTTGRAGVERALRSNVVDFAPIALEDDGTRWTMATGGSAALLFRLRRDFPQLSTMNLHVFQGLKTSADKIYMVITNSVTTDLATVTNGLGEQFQVEPDLLRPVVKGENVLPYFTDLAVGLRILYPYTVDNRGRAHLLGVEELASRFPRGWSYLQAHRPVLGSRDRGTWAGRQDWYAYSRSQNIGTFLGPKFLVPYMTRSLRVDYDDGGELFFVNITTGGYGVRFSSDSHSPYYLLGLFNSSLWDYCIRTTTNSFRGGYFAVSKQAIERLPFRTIDFSSASDRRYHDELRDHVLEMRRLTAAEASARTELDRVALRRRVGSLRSQLNRVVFELYSLGDGEIAAVESGLSQS